MKNSLCAHCIHATDISNHCKSFECSIRSSDDGTYVFCTNARVSDVCEYFENDADQFNKALEKAKKFEITKEKWLKLYDYIDDKINECIKGLRDTYEQGVCLPYTHDLRGERQVLISIQTLMLNMSPTESLYGNAWKELEKVITLAADRGTPTEKRVSEHIMTKMGCIKLSIDN